eukprot:UN07730
MSSHKKVLNLTLTKCQRMISPKTV